MNTKNTILWILLMILMIVNFWMAERSPETQYWTLLLILSVTMIKFLAVALQYMDLKNANRGWQIILIAFVTIFAGITMIF